ncbi:MAG: hypothetical protein WC054_14480, partial [Candidatus Nanopelagicales bacterium]
DVSSLLLAAKVGDQRLVVIDADFPRLDSTVVATLARDGMVVLGAAATAEGAKRLTAFGVSEVVSVSTSDVAAAVGVIRDRLDASQDRQPQAAISQATTGARQAKAQGRLVAVWGAPGAPGRTCVALTVAQLSAAAGVETLLVDADSTAPGVGAALCLEPDGSGLIAAAHHSDRGTLDVAVMSRLARTVDDRFRILTGVSHVSRRAELRAAAMGKVWQTAMILSELCVVDVGGCVDDGSLAFDADIADFGLNSGGHSAAVTALAVADELIAVTTCEPVAIARMLSHLGAIRSLAPTAELRIVVNRVRSPLVRNATAAEELREFVRAQTGAQDVTLVAEDRGTFDQAMLNGVTPFEQHRKSPFVADLTAALPRLTSPLLASA